MNISQFNTPIVDGILEGYQTFDAIGAVLVGGVIIISLNLKKDSAFEDKGVLIRKAGLRAGIGLFVIYAGLIAVGSFYGDDIFIDRSLSNDMQRADLLQGLSQSTLGAIGNSFLSTLIALACFTTAVGIVTGTADYFKGLFKQTKHAFIITAFIGCVVGVLIGQLDFHSIIIIAIPVLMIVYPITILLIFMNVMPEKYASKKVFRAVILVAFIFSIPDFLGSISSSISIASFTQYIPLAAHGFGWVLPSVLAFIAVNAMQLNQTNKVTND